MMARRTFASTLILAALVLAPTPFACGPFFENPVFTRASRPDNFEKFMHGDLGIVWPTFHRIYLYYAYRQLSGRPFAAAELAAAAASSQAARQAVLESHGSRPGNWVNQWRSLEDQVLGTQRPPQADWQVGQGLVRAVGTSAWQYYISCPLDAFRNAVATHEARRTAYSKEELAAWVGAQKIVFRNCGEASDPRPAAAIPEAAPAASSPLFRADRAYQIAAAHFYAERFDEALSRFDAIAADTASPWSKIAPYLAARTLIRKSTLTAPEGAFGAALLQQAHARLRAVLADDSRREAHAMAGRLLNFVRFRLEPEALGVELARKLLSAADAENREQDLIDYTLVMDRLTSGSAVTVPSAAPVPLDEMTDWIFNFQSNGEQALQHALGQWSKGQSPAWMVASLRHVNAGHPRLAELLAAAERVPSSSALYLTVTYHRARLLADAGRENEVRALATRVLEPADKRLDTSALNAFKALRMKVARNFAEFLSDAARIPVDAQPGRPESQMRFDTDAAMILTERVPLAVLVEAALHRPLPEQLRRQAAIAAWTRAFTSGDHESALRVSPALEALAPELKRDLASYRAAATAEARVFAAALLALRHPGMRPFVSASELREVRGYVLAPYTLAALDGLRDNWWCSPRNQNEWQYDYYRLFLNLSPQLQELYAKDGTRMPAFLSDAQRQAAQLEWKQLGALPAAPTLLGRIVLDHAKRVPRDPLLPEALHRVVRATRFGCADAENGKVSRAAFELLHKRYPKSGWAKKTPYWF